MCSLLLNGVKEKTFRYNESQLTECAAFASVHKDPEHTIRSVNVEYN